MGAAGPEHASEKMQTDYHAECHIHPKYIYRTPELAREIERQRECQKDVRLVWWGFEVIIQDTWPRFGTRSHCCTVDVGGMQPENGLFRQKSLASYQVALVELRRTGKTDVASSLEVGVLFGLGLGSCMFLTSHTQSLRFAIPICK